MTAAVDQRAQREEVPPRVYMTLRETPKVSLFETFDTRHQACIHMNCMAHESPDRMPYEPVRLGRPSGG